MHKTLGVLVTICMKKTFSFLKIYSPMFLSFISTSLPLSRIFFISSLLKSFKPSELFVDSKSSGAPVIRVRSGQSFRFQSQAWTNGLSFFLRPFLEMKFWTILRKILLQTSSRDVTKLCWPECRIWRSLEVLHWVSQIYKISKKYHAFSNYNSILSIFWKEIRAVVLNFKMI